MKSFNSTLFEVISVIRKIVRNVPQKASESKVFFLSFFILRFMSERTKVRNFVFLRTVHVQKFDQETLLLNFDFAIDHYSKCDEVVSKLKTETEEIIKIKHTVISDIVIRYSI